MRESESANFRLAQDGVVSRQILDASWCGKLDLLALALSRPDATVEVNVRRLAWQRVTSIVWPHEHVRCLEWSPDGQKLALAGSDGVLGIVDVESGNAECRDKIVCDESLSTLRWIKPSEGHDNNGWEYLGGRITPALSARGDPFSLLFVGTAHGLVRIYALDAELCLASLQVFESDGVASIDVGQSLDRAYVVADDASQVAELDVSALQVVQQELERLSLDLKRISSLLARAREALSSVQKWTAAAQKWRDYQIVLKDALVPYMKDSDPRRALSAIVDGDNKNAGIIDFLARDLSEEQVRNMLREQQAAKEECQDQMIELVRLGLEDMLYAVVELQGLSNLSAAFAGFIDYDDATALVTSVAYAFDAADCTVSQLILTWQKYHALFCWLTLQCIEVADGHAPSSAEDNLKSDVAAFLHEEYGDADLFETCVRETMAPSLAAVEDRLDRVKQKICETLSTRLRITKNSIFGMESGASFTTALSADGFKIATWSRDSQEILVNDNESEAIARCRLKQNLKLVSLDYYRDDLYVVLAKRVEAGDIVVEIGVGNLQNHLRWRSCARLVKASTACSLYVGREKGLASVGIGHRRVLTFDLQDEDEDADELI